MSELENEQDTSVVEGSSKFLNDLVTRLLKLTDEELAAVLQKVSMAKVESNKDISPEVRL